MGEDVFEVAGDVDFSAVDGSTPLFQGLASIHQKMTERSV